MRATEVKMASRLKEDEKNERIIRGLLKLTPNRRCINCNSLGPQYVCTNFWTFVCINCSGIHREFTHRVKSISMAKFTALEVSALQEGGNQRAKEIYFKEWDPQLHSLPDSSLVEKLRDFIKHVYVDRRFSGERTNDKPPRAKGVKDDFYENKRTETYKGGPRSAPYEDRYSDRSSPGGRSPGYDQENRQYGGDYKISPGRPPIVNDWRREERFGDGRKYEDNKISDGNHKWEGHSPDRTKDPDSSSPPAVRPVREILGENVVPLRISEPPKTNSGLAANGSTFTQRTASSSSLESSHGTSVEVKSETLKSLIDFDDDPEPSVAPAIPQAHQTAAAELGTPANSNDNNWASFDSAPEAKTAHGPSNVIPLESVLTQLTVPVSLPSQVSQVQGPVTGSTLTAAATGGTIASSFSTFPPSGASVTSFGLMTSSTLNNAGQWAGLQYQQQQQQPLFAAAISQPSIQQATPPVGGALNNQPWTIPSVPLVQGYPNTSMPHVSHVVPKSAIEAKSSVVFQSSTVDMKPSGRSELPEDLFTVKYSSFPAPVPGWQMGLPPSMGISIPYNNAVPIPSFPQASKSKNPFDVNNEPTPVQAPTFPSMSSLQGALAIPSATMHSSNMGNPSLAWNPSSSSYVSVPPLQAQTLAPEIGPGAYMGQQMATNIPMPRHQGFGNFTTEETAFGFSNPDQKLSGSRLSTAVTPNTFQAGGNPFG